MQSSKTLEESLDRHIYMLDIFGINLLIDNNIISLSDLLRALERGFISYKTSVAVEIYEDESYRLEFVLDIIDIVFDKMFWNSDMDCIQLLMKLISKMINPFHSEFNDEREDTKAIILRIKNLAQKLIEYGGCINENNYNICILLDNVDTYISHMKIKDVDFETYSIYSSDYFFNSVIEYLCINNDDINFWIKQRGVDKSDKIVLNKIIQIIRNELCDCDSLRLINLIYQIRYDKYMKLLLKELHDYGFIFNEADSYGVIHLLKKRYIYPELFASCFTLDDAYGIEDIFKNIGETEIINGFHRIIYDKMQKKMIK